MRSGLTAVHSNDEDAVDVYARLQVGIYLSETKHIVCEQYTAGSGTSVSRLRTAHRKRDWSLLFGARWKK